MNTCRHISHSNPALIIPCPECGNDWKFVEIEDEYLSKLLSVIVAARLVVNETGYDDDKDVLIPCHIDRMEDLENHILVLDQTQ